MKHARIVVPIIVTAVVTVLVVLTAKWLIGLVPAGEWSDFIKAAIVIFIVGSTLLIIAWSAYFANVIRETVERFLKKE